MLLVLTVFPLFTPPASAANLDPSDPAYPIHQSRSEFAAGNLDTAWSLYSENADRYLPVMRDLPIDYGFWLLQRHLDEDENEPAEKLVRELTIWSRQAEGVFTPQQDASLRIAFAELSLRKGNLDTARAWYRQVADTADLRGTPVHLEAALGSVRVDRISRNFTGAINELDALMRIDDPVFRLAAQAARAEVLMDQENFAEALREIEAVLRAKPRDPEALILRGKIQYRMRKLVEASEIEVGPSIEETVLVPGEPLKINLRDPSLSVSGLGADVEVEVRSSSGDHERVLLTPFGDSRDRLRAEISTALGKPTPGDRVLQILGDDEIRFGYSREFRARMKDLPPDPDTVITVASDARLALSAAGFPAREGERRLTLEELGIGTAQAALGARSVRPGNPIYIRLNDPDQCKTIHPDHVALSLFTSSGDEIRNLELIESGSSTGEFQAVVPTATATATAFASESASGRDPNMAISTPNHPGWLGLPGQSEDARMFGIDLNDDAAIDRMQVHTGGQAFTHFVVQTSMNGVDWITRARFPAEDAPWDGHPQIASFPTYRGGIAVTDPVDRTLPADWLRKMDVDSARPSCRYLSARVANLVPDDKQLVNTGHPGYSGLFRFRAVFYQPAAAIRRFRLEGLPFRDNKEVIRTLFLIDGQPADENSDDPHGIERELAPGLHTIEVWHHGGRAAFLKSKPRLLCDQPGQAELVPCPDAMFDPATFPDAVRAGIAHHATINQPEGEAPIGIAFHNSTRSRLIRLAIFGFQGEAPRIDRITLSDREGATLLPIGQDFMELRQNGQLEVLPGDTITARYEDPVFATPKRKLHEQLLRAAFNDGTIAVSFLNYETNKDGERVFVPQPIRRFRFDDALTVLIDDADLDTTPERDTVEFTVANPEGTTITLQAVETAENTGSFMGRFFPVESEPSRASEIQLAPGAALTISCRDAENLTPGIPAERSTTINHALYQTPALAAYSQTTEALEETETPAPAKNQPSWMQQSVRPRRAIDFAYQGEDGLSQTQPALVLGAPLRFDIVAPHLALTHTSEIHAFVQTESARKAASIADGGFNINVPGTLRLAGGLGSSAIEVPPGYTLRKPPVPPTNSPALEEGRFAFAIPITLGPRPAKSFATREARDLPASEIPASLAAREGETIHIGYAWQDPDDRIHWKTASFRVESHAFLDVMESGYAKTIDNLYIGERAYVRLTAPGLSRSDKNDTATVNITAGSGAAAPLDLYETEPHSGVFTGSFEVRIASDGKNTGNLPPVAGHGFPARYGDTITITHGDQSHTIAVNLGADGLIEPFTKRFAGDDMAIQTSFVLAEAYFELAKKHNEMDEESLARRQIGQAHRLLAEAVANHHDENLKAHAEFLLGNLAMEFAELARNDEARIPMYQDALARFVLITDDFPDSEFAPKAQLKIAQTYELMGETSSAIEEYVKLAYKYPDHELIPTVMARLGAHFQKTGQEFKDEADPLRENQDSESIAEVVRLDQLASTEFLNAANVYAKLERRFPNDALAGLASLSAGQNYMRAHRYNEAIDQFQRVIDNPEYDGPSLRAQALYWAGLSHERLIATYSEDNWKGRGTAQTSAYQLYRRVTFDFPDSNWAKFARGRLADPAFERLVKEEAIKRARVIEALKESRK